jgi:DNA polymerase-3 subunit gamma/tau
MTTLHRKYKPYYLNEFILKPKLKSILDALFKIDDLNCLFIGDSNSGKTTILECILRTYYNINKCQSFPQQNILVINNLKEQGINYYRNEMKTFCQSKCTIYGKKKTIVIDDIDTINEQCQQVFRNYIDKYNNNVNFICVCSNVQKVIETIQSRLYVFKLHLLDSTQIRTIIDTIATNEKILLGPYVEDYLIKISDYNIRNIIHYLEKIFIYTSKSIDLETCKQLCSNISMRPFEDFIKYMRQQNISDSLALIYNYYDHGYSVIDILEFFFCFIKQTPLLEQLEKYKITKILCKYITIFHVDQEDPIELALFVNDVANVFIPANDLHP